MRIFVLLLAILASAAVASEITVKDTSTGKTYVITLPDVVEGSVREVDIEPPPPPIGEAVPLPDEHGNILLDQAGKTYTLDRDVESRILIANEGITLRLNGHRVVTEAQSIQAYVSWIHKTYGRKPPSKGFRLVGPGHVESIKSWTVSSAGQGTLDIDGATLVCHAEDRGCVRGGLLTQVRNCLCISHVTSTANRHQLPAVISNSSGKLIVERCVILGGQVGINTRSDGLVKDNFISQNGFATNGYGVAMSQSDGVVVEGNLILPNNGRGVIVHQAIRDAVADRGNVIRDNVIFARETPNSEFGDSLTAACIRIRWTRKNIVERNVCLAIGGVGATGTGAAALYLSQNAGIEPPNIYRSNAFQSVLSGDPDRTRFGKAVTFEPMGRLIDGVPQFATDVIQSNNIVSNHMCISCAGGDAWMRGAHLSEDLLDNEIILRDGGEIIESFIGAIQSRYDELELNSDTALERMTEVIEDLRSLQSMDVGVKSTASHVWTSSDWRAPATLTIRGSGPERSDEHPDGLIIIRSDNPGYPTKITVE